MTKHKYQIVLVIIVLTLAILACEGSVSTANIASATTALDSEGNQPTTVFAQDAIFYCVLDLANAPDDTVVKAVWTAIEAEDVDPNFLLNETEITTGSAPIHFELSNDYLWPIGTYKVDLYLNGELDQTLEFEVQ